MITGNCDGAFASLRELLWDRRSSGQSTGEAIAVVIGGITRVNLSSGSADQAGNHPWGESTLACLFSASKPLAAVAVLHLAQEGRIRLDLPVAHYWPRFAQRGKEAITVRHVLSHMAGIPAADEAPPASYSNAQLLAVALESQRPEWPAGTQGCFHSFTYGVLSAELVRRVDGRSLAQYFREEISGPAGLDLHLGLGPNEQARCAEVALVSDNPLFRLMTDPTTRLGQSWAPMRWEDINSSLFRGSGFASIGAHGSALGLARFYAMLANGDGVLSLETCEAMRREQWHGVDAFMGMPVRMGLGVMLANEILPLTGPTGFAQPGLGGTAGVGDVDNKLGIGIVCNRLSDGLDASFLRDVIQIVTTGL